MSTSAGTQPVFPSAPSPAEAVRWLCEAVTCVGSERVELADATGRVLAESIRADRPSPAVDVSSMDGFAVRAAEVSAGPVAICGELRIGQAPPSLPAGHAFRIVTGAPIPDGADAVLRREDAEEAGGGVRLRQGSRHVQPGGFIRRRAENIDTGGVVAGEGSVLTAAGIAALAACGATRPLVHQRVRVAIIVTGDEVVPPHQTPTAWQLRDSNGAALRALFAPVPWLEIVESVHAPDEVAALRRAVERAAQRCDALLLTGGVSMGERDFVPGVLQESGARVVFHKVPQRPGRPILGAVLPGGRPVLALPGNPVSVLVTARRIAAPVLRRMAGVREAAPQAGVQVRIENTIDLWSFRHVRMVAPGRAEAVAGMGSGDVVSAAKSDGLVEVPPGASGDGPWPYVPWAVS